MYSQHYSSVSDGYQATREETERTVNERDFLELFSVADRNPISQYFHFRVREGAVTPNSVVLRVAAHVGVRIAQAFGDGTEHRRQQAYLDAIADHLDLALRFAEHVITWEAMSPVQRETIKAQRSEQYRTEYMAQHAATERQIAYLNRLNYRGPAPTNKAEASALIDRLLAEGTP